MKRILCFLLVFICSTILSVSEEIKSIDFGDGRNFTNRIEAPTYSKGKSCPIFFSIDQSLDQSAPVIRPFASQLEGVKLSTDLNIEELVLAAIAEEGESMGFFFVAEDEALWKIHGVLKDFYLTCKKEKLGHRFVGFMDLELSLSGPNGLQEEKRYVFHVIERKQRLGSIRIEGEEAIAQVLIEGAQEILARLNTHHFQLQPSSSLKFKQIALEKSGFGDNKHNVRQLALAPYDETRETLKALLKKKKKGMTRYHILNFLALMATPEETGYFINIYRKESDYYARCYLIKALSLCEGASAQEFLSRTAANDPEAFCAAMVRRDATRTTR